MRIKVECAPPLPTIKAWFVPPAISTVLDLKTSLCSELPALQHLSARDIALSLDGFEVLDSSSIDVVRDGELISVKQVVTTAQKRKDREEASPPPAKRAKITRPSATKKPPAITTTENARDAISSKSSSDSDSDESPDSESSEESEDSSSESDDSSDESSSSTSSSSAPSVRTSKATIPTSTSASIEPSKRATTPAEYVPPGHGKASTQSRNIRRRRKRMYERLVSQVDPSNVNDIPVGQKNPVEPVPEAQPVAPTIMMASLSNKNKRKGFKRAMASTFPKKIVFEGTVSASTSELPFASTPADITAEAPNLFPRLIPPSEKQEKGQIPPNIFVTSVDVGEGLPARKKKTKRRAETVEVETLVLDYGEAVEAEETAPARDNVASGDVDWTFAEQRWESLVKLSQPEQVSEGTVLGWKALGLNPSTFTPEIMLNIGRATAVGDKLTVQPMQRPGFTSASFGAYEEDEEAEPAEEVLAWEDVFSGDWRIIAV